MERNAADEQSTGLCFPGAVTSELVQPNSLQAADGLAADKGDSHRWATAALVCLFLSNTWLGFQENTSISHT